MIARMRIYHERIASQLMLFVTRRGAVHAAGEGRHLHGGHGLVRTCCGLEFAEFDAVMTLNSFSVPSACV